MKMEFFEEEEESSSEEKEVKPILFDGPNTSTSESISLSPSLISGSKKWSPSSLQDGNRKSAFLPYKQQNYPSCNTVLTNLQRGNTHAETPDPQVIELNFHTKAGQGEISEEDIKNENNVDVLDVNKLTALHWACSHGQLNAVQLLLNHGASVNKLGPEEESPLILGASEGHHEVVRLLINHGADVNHIDHLCNSSLMYAAKGNHPHTCQELLMNHADFSLVNLNDDTAHIIAVDNGSTLAQAVIENFLIMKIEASPGSFIADKEGVN